VSLRWSFPLNVENRREHPRDMESLYDYKKYAILYVDDEEKSLKYFTRAFEETFRIYTATNAQDGLKLIEEHAGDIGVLTDRPADARRKGCVAPRKNPADSPAHHPHPGDGVCGHGRGDLRREHRSDLQIRDEAVGSGAVGADAQTQPGVLPGPERARPVAPGKRCPFFTT
jgi:Response regulator containing CheY-like receiver domain and AraC-type DNA-binding domain